MYILIKMPFKLRAFTKAMRIVQLFTLLTAASALVASAQNNQRTLSGYVFDQDKKLPVAFAQVELFNKSNNRLIVQATTDTAGKFQLMTGEKADLTIKVSYTGYLQFSTVIPAGTQSIVLQPVYLKTDTRQLKAVTISASAPLVRQQVDRLSYNVQADPESKINSLLDMLRKVPLLSVDADDNVKLKGSQSYKILIDGKESTLMTNNPKDVLRSMPASNILRVEVITTPPAKYDAEGLTGIINIVTIKKIDNGYSGSLGASYKFPNGPRANASITFKQGKFGLSAFAGVTEYNTPHTGFTNSQQGFASPAVSINQDGAARTDSHLNYISTQLSYEIDSLNLITANLGYNKAGSNKTSNIYTLQLLDTLTQGYNLNTIGNNKSSGYDLGLDYQLGFKRNKSQLLVLSYKFSHNNNRQYNAITASREVNYQLPDYNQDNKTGTNEHTFQLDYTHPLKQLTIESGIKAILRNNYSNYQVNDFDATSNSFVPDPDNSNQFTYQQNVYSIYNSYLLKLKKWTIQAGLRAERTEINADFFNDGLTAIPGYNTVIPSVSVQDKLTNTTSVNLGYTERILRPGIMQLNPFIDQQNPQFISYGNPNLKPELNHILTLNYGIYKAVTVNFGLGYSWSNNTIQYVSTLGGDGITRNTFENLGKNNNLEADMNISWPISNKLNLSINGQISYLRLTGVVDSTLYTRKAMTGNANVYLGYKFNNDWRAGFNFLYFSPLITLQGTSSPYYYTSLSLSKNIGGKLNISGSVSNPFLRYLDYKNKITGLQFYQITHNDIVYRRFNIGINYKFGKLKDGSIKRNKKGIENNDIKVVPPILPGN